MRNIVSLTGTALVVSCNSNNLNSPPEINKWLECLKSKKKRRKYNFLDIHSQIGSDIWISKRYLNQCQAQNKSKYPRKKWKKVKERRENVIFWVIHNVLNAHSQIVYGYQKKDGSQTPRQWSKYLKKVKLKDWRENVIFGVMNNVFNAHSQIYGYKMVYQTPRWVKIPKRKQNLAKLISLSG